MIEVINSKDLTTDTDMVCTYCGKDHSVLNKEIEGENYIFERDTISKEEWCICVECKKKWDNQ